MPKLVAVSTTAYDGYDLETAFKEISSLGCEWVEIASIPGLIEHVRAADINSEHARYVKDLMTRFHLSSTAFSGPVDLSEDQIVPAFKARMKFAKDIGAKIINTNAAPRERAREFYENMGPIADYAEILDLIVGLEPHGNIVDSGKSGAEVVSRIGSDYVKINYDFGNVLYYSNGRIRPEEDLNYALESVVHFHIKDLVWVNGVWRCTSIGKGVIDYERIFAILKKEKCSFPATIEVPLRLSGTGVAPYTKSRGIPRISEINGTIWDSLAYVRNLY